MIKSNLDVAYELVLKKKSPVEFLKLWEEVSEVQGFNEEEAKARIGKFYTNLFKDGRFITLGENTWDLRDRYTFDKVHIDMNDVYHDEDEEDTEIDEETDEVVVKEEEEETPLTEEPEEVEEAEEEFVEE